MPISSLWPYMLSATVPTMPHFLTRGLGSQTWEQDSSRSSIRAAPPFVTTFSGGVAGGPVTADVPSALPPVPFLVVRTPQ